MSVELALTESWWSCIYDCAIAHELLCIMLLACKVYIITCHIKINVQHYGTEGDKWTTPACTKCIASPAWGRKDLVTCICTSFRWIYSPGTWAAALHVLSYGSHSDHNYWVVTSLTSHTAFHCAQSPDPSFPMLVMQYIRCWGWQGSMQSELDYEVSTASTVLVANYLWPNMMGSYLYLTT